MRLFYIAILISFQLHLASQNPERPYEKIMFPNLSPDWHFVNYDEEMDNGEFDGYNNVVSVAGFESEIFENFIFEIFYRQNTLEPTGTYIQKRDLLNGELIWRKYIGYPNDPQQIMGRDILINANENVEVICQVKCDPYDSATPLLGRDNMALYKIELDSENGNIIDEIDYVCNDSMYLQTNFDGFYLIDVSRFYSVKDTFYFTQGLWTGSNWEFEIFKLEDNYVANDVFSKRYPRKYNCQGSLPIIYNDSVKVVFNTNCASKQLELTFIDENLDPIKTIISDSLSQELRDLRVELYDPIKGWFLLENVINLDTKEIEFLIINSEGQLLKRLIMPNVYNRNYGILEWTDLDNIVVLSRRTNYTVDNNFYVSFDILKPDQSGNLTKSHSFVPTDSLRFFSYMRLVSSDDEHYYLEFNEGSYSTNLSIDKRALAKSMMKIKKQLLLNPITSTSDNAKKTVFYFPNPTSGLVRLQNLKEPVTITVFDMNGNQIRTFNNVISQIQIHELPAGLYILELRSDNLIEKIRVIKMD